MTPHIEAKKEDIAKTVIMPGDPKRAVTRRRKAVNLRRGSEAGEGRLGEKNG